MRNDLNDRSNLHTQTIFSGFLDPVHVDGNSGESLLACAQNSFLSSGIVYRFPERKDPFDEKIAPVSDM